jgi:hypothetical protein
MGYYLTSYEFAGIPIYVGTGVEDEFGVGDIPFLSIGDMFYTAATEGRIEISARDVLIHGASWYALEKGSAFALRKGFLDAALFGTRFGLHGTHAARMGMNRLMMAGAGTAVQHIARGTFARLPGILSGAALYGAGQFLHDLHHDLSGMFIGDLRWHR